MEAFADDSFKIAKMMKPLFKSVENIVGKGKNAGCQHFLLFPHNIFKGNLHQGRLKSGLYDKGLKLFALRRKLFWIQFIQSTLQTTFPKAPLGKYQIQCKVGFVESDDSW